MSSMNGRVVIHEKDRGGHGHIIIEEGEYNFKLFRPGRRIKTVVVLKSMVLDDPNIRVEKWTYEEIKRTLGPEAAAAAQEAFTGEINGR